MGSVWKLFSMSFSSKRLNTVFSNVTNWRGFGLTLLCFALKSIGSIVAFMRRFYFKLPLDRYVLSLLLRTDRGQFRLSRSEFGGMLNVGRRHVELVAIAQH